MLVAGGKARGTRRLKALPKQGVRPTKSIVRSATFNVLASRINFTDFAFIDAFGGTGAMGIEAFGRGFSLVFIIERDAQAFQAIQLNTQDLSGNGAFFTVKAACQDIISRFLNKAPSLVIYLDPPYSEQQEIASALATIEREAPRSNEIIAVAETPAIFDVTNLSNWTVFQTKKYGKTHLTFLRLDAGNNSV